MAIVVNGISIPTNGDFVVVNGVKVTKVVANGIVVWEKETAPPAKNAPPFLSAGWRACRVIRSWEGDKGWSISDQIDGSYILHVSYADLGTKYISENGIDTGVFWIENDYYQYDTYDAYLFHSPTIDASSYTYFVAGEEINLDDDASNLSREFYHISRFSNDGLTWTDWLWTNETKKTLYKYAQVGVFFGAINGDDNDAWFRFKLISFTFH